MMENGTENNKKFLYPRTFKVSDRVISNKTMALPVTQNSQNENIGGG